MTFGGTFDAVNVATILFEQHEINFKDEQIMSKLVTNGSKYSDEERTQAAIHYAVTGSLVKTEEATGIPDSTIGTWKKQDWWEELVGSVRGEKSEEHRAMYSKLVDVAQEKALELLPTTKCAKTAMLVACMGTDKVRLHDGMPTAITGKSENMAALAQEFRKLSEQWEEKQVNVVAVQEESEELE